MEADQPHRKHRARLWSTVFLVLAVAVFALWFRQREPLYASPRAPRTDVDRLFSQSWDDYLAGRPASPSPARTAIDRLPGIQVLHYPNGDLINFQQGDGSEPHVDPPPEICWADEEGVAALPGGGALRLLAFALRVPRESDLEDKPDGRFADLVFRTPRTREVVPEDQLDRWGLPADARKVRTSENWFPVVRLVLDVDPPEAELGAWNVFDARSHGYVTQAVSLHSRGRSGPWVLDTDLSIWHETPLLFAIDVACGQPMHRELGLNNGDQVAFEDRARLQLLTLMEGRVETVRTGASYRYLLADRNQPGTTVAYRVAPKGHEHRFALALSSGDDRETLALRPGSVGWTHSRFSKDDIDALRVRFLPERARVFLRLDGLAGMPNGEGVGNLFDVRIPRFSIPSIPTEDGTLAYIFLDLVTGATMTEVNHWTSSLSLDVSDDYLPRDFVDTSPREILQEYLSFSEDPYVRLDRDRLELVFHRPEPWRVRLERWWYLHAPDWLKW